MWLDDIRRDIAYAARSFARTPGFTIVVTLTLALGIGANTAIFSVVRAVILRPLPYAQPDRLVVPYENVPAAETPNHQARRQGGMVLGEINELQHRTTTLSHISVVVTSLVTGIGDRESTLISGAILSPGTLAMLGVQPELGRWFTSEEEQRVSHVVILSDTAWRKYFDADPAVLHRTMTFNGNSSFIGDVALGAAYEIVGIMPRGFHFPSDATQFWLPARGPQAGVTRLRGMMVARLRDGATLDAAAAEVATIVADFRGRTASHAPFAAGRFEFVRVQNEADASLKQALLVLMAAVGLVLLIACANVANLLLARTAAREREITVRISLGAGRGRLIRQLLTESVLLALAGGLIGTVLAFGGVALFHRLATNLARFDLGSGTAVVPRLDVIAVDRVVLAFAVTVSVVVGVLFGIAPAIRSAHQLQTERSASRLHGALIVAEIALTLPLLVGGALLVRTFINLVSVDPGFDVTHAVTFQVGVRGDKYPPAQLKMFADTLVERLRAVPDVIAIGYGRQLPMVQLQDTHSFRTKPDLPPPGPVPDGADGRYVSTGYLPAIGARLVAGRWPSGPREVAINRTLARREFGSQNPIGATVYIGRNAKPLEVAAVVDDERLFGLDREPPPQFFADLSLWDGPPYTLLPVGPYFAIRTRAQPQAVLRNVASVVQQLDTAAPLFNVATLEQIVSNSVTLPRLYAVLLGVFAAVAIGLASVGIYGVTAYAVVRRTREIGIRMALGANRVSVIALILGRGAKLTIAGIAIGVMAAIASTRYLASLLFGLTARDVTTFVGSAVIFSAVATVACYVPARRATRVDPSVALRAD
jgi:predicted permease